MADSANRLSIIEGYRNELRVGLEAIGQAHQRGLEAVAVCRRITTLADGVVEQIYRGALADLDDRTRLDLEHRIALVAHGGYGRRQLAPYSDIDLMILHDGPCDDSITQFARELTQGICDVRIDLGHSLRNESEVAGLAKQDPVIATSLVEHRHLCGGLTLYERFRDRYKRMMKKWASNLAPRFIAAREQEQQEYGASVCMLEPNLKRSRGGLRDIHLLRWLWYLRHGETDIDRLHSMGTISKFDYRRLLSAQAFLLRIRNQMHFHHQSRQDLLSRADQLRLANELGYQGKAGVRPVEQLMKDYFRHTHHIDSLASRLTELMTPESRVSRVLGPMLGRSIDGYYRLGVRDIQVSSRGKERLKHHPEEVCRLVDLARHYDKWIPQDVWYHIYISAPNYTTRLSSEVLARFIKLLDNPSGLGQVMRRLHHLGVLEKFIPQFSDVRYLLQFNQYHQFTVDEHCVRAVDEAIGFARRDDVLGETYRRLPAKGLLHLALLIHDLGKGQEEDHSEVGRRIALETADRFAMDGKKKEMLAFLVHKHLLMSHVAFRRDTSRPETISQFAEEVGTIERLTMLFVLTCADFAAVAPGVLNDWKVEVLTDLFQRTRQVFLPNYEENLQASREVAHQKVRDELAKLSEVGPWAERQLQHLPDLFTTEYNAIDLAQLLARLSRLFEAGATDGPAMDTWGEPGAIDGTYQFYAGVLQGSGRGYFSGMAGALNRLGMGILSADTNVLEGDLLYLRFLVRDEGLLPGQPTERIEHVAEELHANIGRQERPKFPRVFGSDRKVENATLSSLPQRVRILPDVAPDAMVIEVFAIDRMGLLYDLARALHDLELVIISARIATYLDQVVDVFYVADRQREKPTDPALLHRVTERLTEIGRPDYSP